MLVSFDVCYITQIHKLSSAQFRFRYLIIVMLDKFVTLTVHASSIIEWISSLAHIYIEGQHQSHPNDRICPGHQHSRIIFNRRNMNAIHLSWTAALILGLCPAKERRPYFVTTSLVGWAQASNQPLNCIEWHDSLYYICLAAIIRAMVLTHITSYNYEL